MKYTNLILSVAPRAGSVVIAILNCEIAIPNFNIVRRDRNRNGGGVTVYIKDCFEFKIISHGPLDLEFYVHNGNKRICVCLLYRPPSSSTTFFDNLYSTFVNLNVSLFSHVLVFGDFNVDFLNVNHPLFSKLCNILDSSFICTACVTTHPCYI